MLKYKILCAGEPICINTDEVLVYEPAIMNSVWKPMNGIYMGLWKNAEVWCEEYNPVRRPV
jgi:hypothetical protein